MHQEKQWNSWFFFFSVVHLILGCFLFKKFKKFNESCSLSKEAKMSSKYLIKYLGFLQKILSFVLSRKFIDVYNNLAQKYETVTVKDFCKYEKLQYKE